MAVGKRSCRDLRSTFAAFFAAASLARLFRPPAFRPTAPGTTPAAAGTAPPAFALTIFFVLTILVALTVFATFVFLFASTPASATRASPLLTLAIFGILTIFAVFIFLIASTPAPATGALPVLTLTIFGILTIFTILVFLFAFLFLLLLILLFLNLGLNLRELRIQLCELLPELHIALVNIRLVMQVRLKSLTLHISNIYIRLPELVLQATNVALPVLFRPFKIHRFPFTPLMREFVIYFHKGFVHELVEGDLPL